MPAVSPAKRTRAKGSADSKARLQDRETCFVMMPFTQIPKSYYELVYKPAIEAAGLTPRRADDIYAPSPIISDIWREVRRARVMLADLTFRNPNVMYELGLAHAVGKPVVMLTQNLADVPFDLQQYRLIPYSPLEPDWSKTLAGEITRSLHDVLKTPTKFVLPVFLRESDAGDRPTVGAVEKRLASLERTVDRIEAQVRAKPTAVATYVPTYPGYPSQVPVWARVSTVAPSTSPDPLNEAWTRGWNAGLTRDLLGESNPKPPNDEAKPKAK
jgi:hypothetical protein